ncbi:MAG: hypothetical protein AAFO80_16765, partial [Pseudomonadota bacterium]
MGLRLTGIAAAMATVSVLATGAAIAQTGWAVDALLRDAANPPSVRSIDRTTRPEKRYAIVIGMGIGQIGDRLVVRIADHDGIPFLGPRGAINTAQTGWAVDALLRDAANPPSVRSI